MGTERQVMQGYLDALFKRAGDYSDYFADDVVASMEGTGQHAEGRQAVVQFIKNLLVDDRKAAIEADFVGTHTGEFAGVRATGRTVRVPYSVVYDLRDDKITQLRMYFPVSLLVEQLTS